MAYVGQYGNPNNFFKKDVASYAVVVDGKVGPKHGQVSTPVFSSDGKHVAYIAEDGNKRFAVIDGERSQTIAGSVKNRLIISPDGKRLAYVASRGPKRYLVVDSQPGPEYKLIDSPIISPDGKRVAYVAGNGDKKLVVLDGVPQPEYSNVIETDVEKGYVYHKAVIFSSDSKHLAYIGDDGVGQFVVLDGVPGPKYQSISLHSLMFSSNGQRLAYLANDHAKSFLVVDGQPGQEFDDTASLLISSDGSRIAYVAKNGNNSCLLVDGKRGRQYEDVCFPIISPDGQRVAYLARNGPRLRVVVDDQPGSDSGGINLDGDDPFGPLRSGDLTLTFSPDSKHLAYIATDGKHFHVVLDGVAGPDYDHIWGRPAFGPDGALEYIAYKNNGVYRVKVAPRVGKAAGNSAPIGPAASTATDASNVHFVEH